MLFRSDLTCDLTEGELISIDYNKYKSRKARSADKGLLCIYPIIGEDREGKKYGNAYPLFAYAVDFPESQNDGRIEYIVDDIMEKEFDD